MGIVFAKLPSITDEQKKRIGKQYGSPNYSQNILLSKHCRISSEMDMHRPMNVLAVSDSFEHGLEQHVIPNIAQLDGSYVVLDLTGEILAKTGTFLKEHGYDIKVLNFKKPEESDFYNPFVDFDPDLDDIFAENAAILDEIKCLMPRALDADEFFFDSAKALLEAVMLYMYSHLPAEDLCLENLGKIITEKKYEEWFTEPVVTESSPYCLKAYDFYKTATPAKTKKAIDAAFKDMFAELNRTSSIVMSTKNDFSLRDLQNGKTALFIVSECANDDVVTLILKQAYYGLQRTKTRRLNHVVRFILDEYHSDAIANYLLPRPIETTDDVSTTIWVSTKIRDPKFAEFDCYAGAYVMVRCHDCIVTLRDEESSFTDQWPETEYFWCKESYVHHPHTPKELCIHFADKK